MGRIIDSKAKVMSMEAWIYLADISETLKIWSVVIATLSVCALAFLGIVHYASGDGDDDEKKHMKSLKYMTVLTIFFLTCSIFIPTKNTLYAITAVSLSKEIGLNKTAEKALKLLDSKLDKVIAEKNLSK